MKFSSKLVENAVNEVSKLPGIGKRSALRTVLYLLKQSPSRTEQLSSALTKLRNQVNYCSVCKNISDQDICEICNNPKRDSSLVCVVENIEDVMAIENTAQFNGLYHVLGGVIAPMQGIVMDDLEIDSLLNRLKTGYVEEVVFALSSTVEADTTSFYIYKKISNNGIKVSTIARGIPVGNDLEYTDELTLGRSILARIPFEHSFNPS